MSGPAVRRGRTRRAPAAVLGAVALAATAAAAAVPWGRDAMAQDLGASYDPSLPIEITADSLEVTQQDQVAVFSGNVDAVQGTFVLSAELVRVYYRRAEDGTGADVAPGAAGGAVRRIEAEGGVFLSSPDETAQGRVGVYDVDGERVTLDGDVVLTRGETVIRGAHLDLDLASGRARVTGAVAGDAEAPPEQRVRAIFVPDGEGGGDEGGGGGGNGGGGD